MIKMLTKNHITPFMCRSYWLNEATVTKGNSAILMWSHGKGKYQCMDNTKIGMKVETLTGKV